MTGTVAATASSAIFAKIHFMPSPLAAFCGGNGTLSFPPDEPESVEIAAFGDDFDVPWVARGGRPPASGCVSGVARGGQALVAQVTQHMAVVLDAARDDMNDVAVLVALDDAVHRHQPRPHDDLALPGEHVGPDDEVGDSGLILDGDEDDALGAARPLADQHQPGQRQALAVADGLERIGGDELSRGVMLAEERH